MAISLSSVQVKSLPKPPRMTIYGVAGVGKTSFAASSPNPIFIQTEDGLSSIEAPTFGVLKSLNDVLDAIGALYTEDHNYQTVVLDSLDWLEPVVNAQVCKDNGWASIEAPGYGKGHVAALDSWRLILEGLNALRDEKNMAILMIAHSDIKKFDAPDTDGYSRYVLKLQAKLAALISEHSDIIGFANYRTSTVTKDGGFGKKTVRGVGAGERLLHLQERPGFIAKQRYDLPESVPLLWDSVAAGIPFYSNTGA
jgi:hypothetical protein